MVEVQRCLCKDWKDEEPQEAGAVCQTGLTSPGSKDLHTNTDSPKANVYNEINPRRKNAKI